MTAHRIRLGMLAAAASIVFVSADADASKEKFVRDKPHVNIGTIGNQDAQEEKDAKDAKVREIRTEVQTKKEASRSPNESAVEHADDKAKFKRSQGDEAGTLKGDKNNRSLDEKFGQVADKVSPATPRSSANGDDNVAEKTDKDESARAKRKH